LNLSDVVDPRAVVLEIEDAPSEGAGDDNVEPAADGDAGGVLGVFRGVIAAFREAVEGATAVVI